MLPSDRIIRVIRIDHLDRELSGIPKRFVLPGPGYFLCPDSGIGRNLIWTMENFAEQTSRFPGNKAGLAAMFAAAGMVFLTGCSVRNLAIDMAADALSESGSVYAADDDPELVREALPFGLKTMESLAAASPDNSAIRVELAQGFVVYAYLLQDEADRIDASDRAKSLSLRQRAHNHYLRARDYALEALEIRYPDFRATLKSDPAAALKLTTPDDVRALYWAGAGWAAATSLDKDNLSLVAELPVAASLVRRVLELDEIFDDGAAHEFFISYEGARPGGDAELAREHYRRAIEISEGKRASVHLALAESIAVAEQRELEFRQLLDLALAIDPDEIPELRLANTLAQRRARWLLGRMPDLFLDYEGAAAS